MHSVTEPIDLHIGSRENNSDASTPELRRVHSASQNSFLAHSNHNISQYQQRSNFSQQASPAAHSSILCRTDSSRIYPDPRYPAGVNTSLPPLSPLPHPYDVRERTLPLASDARFSRPNNDQCPVGQIIDGCSLIPQFQIGSYHLPRLQPHSGIQKIEANLQQSNFRPHPWAFLPYGLPPTAAPCYPSPGCFLPQPTISHSFHIIPPPPPGFIISSELSNFSASNFHPPASRLPCDIQVQRFDQLNAVKTENARASDVMYTDSVFGQNMGSRWVGEEGRLGDGNGSRGWRDAPQMTSQTSPAQVVSSTKDEDEGVVSMEYLDLRSSPGQSQVTCKDPGEK